MKLADITPAHNVIISANSITVKNPETDKTAGVIRGAGSWRGAPDRVLFSAHENLRKELKTRDTFSTRAALGQVAAVIIDNHFVFIIDRSRVIFCEKYEPEASYLKAVRALIDLGAKTITANKVKTR
jgi:hypothetical protein